MMLFCTIYLKENRCVAVSDIPGAFLHAEISDDNLHMLLKGRIAEIITKLDPTIYRRCILYN